MGPGGEGPSRSPPPPFSPAMAVPLLKSTIRRSFDVAWRLRRSVVDQFDHQGRCSRTQVSLASTLVRRSDRLAFEFL